jgi:hypothetical protein
MRKKNNQHIARPFVDRKFIRSEVIKVRFTKEECLIIKLDCEAVKSPYISTYLREYYFKTRNSELVVINASAEDDLKNIENVIAAQSKLNSCLSLLKKYENSSNAINSDKNKELSGLLNEVMNELHTLKARLRW